MTSLYTRTAMASLSSSRKERRLGQLMRAWAEALLQFEEPEREKVLGNIEIWGQPRAWTVEKISCDLVQFIREQWGQAIVFADCLGAQWTEAVLLRAWLENIIWAPYAPEVTSALHECGTHEHSQFKSRRPRDQVRATLGPGDGVVERG